MVVVVGKTWGTGPAVRLSVSRSLHSVTGFDGVCRSWQCLHSQTARSARSAVNMHPYWYKHINVAGHYSFHAQELGAAGLRPLRDPDLPDDE
jgi:hypothetical protein